MSDKAKEVCKSVALFVAAGLCEIGGGWLVWKWRKADWHWGYFLLGSAILVLYGIIPTLQDQVFGRVYAAYGGFFILLSFCWAWALDGERPDRWDLIGSAIALAGVCLIMFMPRKHVAATPDSLKHRAAAAEIHLLLCPDGKSEAIKIIEDSSERDPSGAKDAPSEWLLKDCAAVRQLLETSFKDTEAVSKWTARCAEMFPYSTYFEGAKSSATLGVANTKDLNHSDNGEVESDSVGEKDHTHSVNGGLRDLVLN